MTGCRAPSEVALPLAILHRRLGHAVVAARLPALGHFGGGDLRDDLAERARRRFDRARAAHVADGAVADARAEGLLSIHQLHERADRVEHAVASEDLALVGEVDRRHLELLRGDVLPHVELGPVGDGKHPRMLAPADAPVVEVPDLRPLALGLPLAELVAKGEDALLRPRPLLVAARAAEGRVEAVFRYGVQQRHGLQRVARGARTGLLDDAPL